MIKPVAKPSQLLAFDENEFTCHFGQEPFLIDHSLADHELFQLDRLVELCQSLPKENVEYNAGEIPVNLSDHSLTPMNGLSPDETIRRIAECKSWLVMKYVETDPAYQQLLNDCLSLVRPYSEPIAPGMTSPQAFIFVTSPGSITPYHIDPEHNFLLQIRGQKHVAMFDGRNKSILSEENLEHFYTDRGRNLPFDEAWEADAWKFTLNPGQGLHFPVTYPHYVRNGDEVSVSFSITFRTPDLDRRRALYSVNDSIRRKGGAPPAVGTRPIRDSLLFQKFRIARKLGLKAT